MHFPAVRMTHRRARRDFSPDFSKMYKRQALSPTFAVVPNQPLQPTVTARQTVTRTVVVPPTAADPDDIPHPILTPVRPELSGIATPTQSAATEVVASQPAPNSSVPVGGQPGTLGSVSPTPVAAQSSDTTQVAPAPTTANSIELRPALTSTSTSTVASDSPTAVSAANAAATSKGISPTAIGVVAGVIALVVVCAVAFFVRRRFLRRRNLRRNTWGAGFLNDRRDAFAPQYEKSTQLQSQPYSSSNETYKAARPDMPNPYDHYPAQQLSSPPMSYNNPKNSFKSSPASVTQPPYSSNSERTTVDPNTVTVLRVFIPSLPDELHIAAGERVRIITSYDDGWALCSNSRGEQGVVPLECLDQPKTAAAPQGGDWRNLKRTSSLYSAGARASGY